MNPWQDLARKAAKHIGTVPAVPPPGPRLDAYIRVQNVITELFQGYVDDKADVFAKALSRMVMELLIIAESYGLSGCLDELVALAGEAAREEDSVSMDKVHEILASHGWVKPAVDPNAPVRVWDGLKCKTTNPK